MKVFWIFTILMFSIVLAQAQDEQAPIQEKVFNYKDWTYKNIRDGSKVNLRDFSVGKKIVLVVYFAPWCHSWKHEAPFVQRMYNKYRSNGLDVIAVGEYGSLKDMKNHLAFYEFTFPMVYESLSRDDREKTLHFSYRKENGDTRKWGSPWNIFLEPANFKDSGEILSEKSTIANGELIEAEVENFIRKKLGLPAIEAKTVSLKREIEPCEGEKKTVEFKKP